MFVEFLSKYLIYLGFVSNLCEAGGVALMGRLQGSAC